MSYTREQKKARNEVAKRNRRRNMEFTTRLKEATPCTDCGRKYPHYVMEFDHLRDKHVQVSTLVQRPCSLEMIQDEIAKCEVVCANCHKERTHQRRLTPGL